MFVESCPGGTIWDDVEKACTWPDMQTSQQLDQQQSSFILFVYFSYEIIFYLQVTDNHHMVNNKK
jgi:hypothetical protein